MPWSMQPIRVQPTGAFAWMRAKVNNQSTCDWSMDDSIERYRRLVRAPVDDPFILTPPKVMMDEVERLGQDPRVPRTAVARFVAKSWAEQNREGIRRGKDQPVTLAARMSEKEIMERPAHFPPDFGLSLIPFPSDVGGSWVQDKLETVCYTSLSTPRPFDPHLHGPMGTPTAAGFGYQYMGSSAFQDRYDITTRRGGGPRGGFSMTTGPTEGNYPSSILPAPVFNLGALGYTDGGYNPEGLQYTNRPKQLRLTGLRNGWKHKAFFARSRQVMFRNVYGPLSEAEATPRAPNIVINGNNPLSGILSVNMSEKMNSSRTLTVTVNSINGRRSGQVKIGDSVQAYMAPKTWANPPLIFTGIVTDISENVGSMTLRCSDSLSLLSNEIIATNSTFSTQDGATVVKNIIASSSYGLPIGQMTVQSRVWVPTQLKLAGKSRLSAVQFVMGFLNSGVNPHILKVSNEGFVEMLPMKDIESTDITPLRGGELPRTTKPLDFYPINIVRSQGDSMIFNVVTVLYGNDGSFTYPAIETSGYPSRPVQIKVKNDALVDDNQAETYAKLLLQNQGRTKVQYTVEGIPERFDIRVGDVMDFATASGIAGRHRIFAVQWEMSSSGPTMTLEIGKLPPDLVSSLRLAADISQ